MVKRLKRKDPGLEAVMVAAKNFRTLSDVAKVHEVTVARWKRIPPEKVLTFEKVFGVSRYKQRPDIYGRAP